jgi:two-component system, sensor histidine kinase and response regulator
MSKIYDYDGSLRRMGNDHELYQEMVGLLRCDVPPLMAALRAAYREGDCPRMQRAAHTLKGLASNFGAGRAVAAAAEVERLAKAQQSAGIPAATTELEEALDELIAALAPTPEMSQSG